MIPAEILFCVTVWGMGMMVRNRVQVFPSRVGGDRGNALVADEAGYFQVAAQGCSDGQFQFILLTLSREQIGLQAPIGIADHFIPVEDPFQLPVENRDMILVFATFFDEADGSIVVPAFEIEFDTYLFHFAGFLRAFLNSLSKINTGGKEK